MNFNQHIDDTILVPQHISKYGCYTAQLFLITFYFLYSLQFYILLLSTFCLYCTTLMHWYKVRHSNFIRFIDMTFAISILFYITFIDDYLIKYDYRYIWNIGFSIIVVVFILNQYLFYKQVIEYYHTNKYQTQQYYYFLKDYTNPNTQCREYAYYRTVYTHLITAHIIPLIICSICVYLSHFK